MKRALHCLVSFEIHGVEDWIMADTVVHQSKQKLQERKGQLLTAMWPPFFQNVYILQGMTSVSLQW